MALNITYERSALADLMADLPKLLLQYQLTLASWEREEDIRRKERQLDRDDADKKWELTLAYDSLKDLRRKQDDVKAKLASATPVYEALLGPILPEEEKTADAKEIGGSNIEQFKTRIESLSGEIETSNEELTIMLSEIASISKIKENLSAISMKYGDPEKYDLPDFTPQKIAETYNLPLDLVERHLLHNPYMFDQEVINSLNKLREQQEAQIALVKLQQREIKSKIVAEKVVHNRFTRDFDGLIKRHVESGDEPESLQAALAGYEIDGVNIAAILVPEGTVPSEKLLEERALAVNDMYNAFVSFKTNTWDTVGLMRVVNKFRDRYDDIETKEIEEKEYSKEMLQERYRDFMLAEFNIDVTNIEPYVLTASDPLTGEQMLKELTPFTVIRNDFNRQELSKRDFYKKNSVKIFDIYRGENPNIDKEKIIDMMETDYNNLSTTPGGRSQTEIMEIRDKLVSADYPLAELSIRDVLGGVAKLATPVAIKFEVVKDELKKQDIELAIMDAYRPRDVQKKAYDKWIAGGGKGPTVANPDMSFHTIGYAFDLAQPEEYGMNNEKVFAALRKAGFIQHDSEWWHWSLEELK